ncbi:hypothetical protein L3Q82_022363 [Scortum barcoo]|uniref:Uncharacterized protein n=1 Tax=Scortum barcoo TaxID=214431 RepID=A0ACB8X1E6_9TELE|nr:hypothetical protein L3Q82_022363 [Scortum barcoo]
MKHITGKKGKDRQTSGSLDRANQFNQFFNPHTPTLSQMARPTPSILLYNTSPSACPPSFSPTPSPSSTEDIRINPCPTVTTGQVKRQLEKLHQRKAAGPDGITPRILKDLCQPAVSCTGTSVQPESESGESPYAVEDVLLGSSPQEAEAIRPGRLQTSRPHISCDEGPGETGLSPAEATEKGEEGEYRTLVDNFVEWSKQNHLRLNVNKTREMVIDFRRKKMPSQPLYGSGGRWWNEVEDYKYLGVVIDNRLDWKSNMEAVYKKGMSRLYFLRKLRSFNVGSKDVGDFLPVCCCQCHFLCCRVLGQQHQSQRHKQT